MFGGCYLKAVIIIVLINGRVAIVKVEMRATNNKGSNSINEKIPFS
jgi:hypothetical protein